MPTPTHEIAKFIEDNLATGVHSHMNACMFRDACRHRAEHFDALLAACKKSLRFLIAERDCHYDSVTDAEGNYTDDEDRMAVEQYDQDIDELQALIARAEGQS